MANRYFPQYLNGTSTTLANGTGLRLLTTGSVRDPAYDYVTANQQWLSRRVIAVATEADPTIRPSPRYALPYQLRRTEPWYRQRPKFVDQSDPNIYGSKNTSTQYTGSDPYPGSQWQVMRRIYSLANQASPLDIATSRVQFLGSNATWGSQQQVNRRQYNLADQSTIPVPDADPTLRRPTQQPYQLYDRTYWTRPRPVVVDQSITVTPDADPTLTRQLFAYSNPYQLRSPLPWYRIRPVLADQSDQGSATTPVKNFAVQYTGSDPYQGSQWQVMRRLYSLADQSTQPVAGVDVSGGIRVQLAGITRPYGSQFQVMQWRRNLADQSDQTPFTPPPPQVFPTSPPGGTSLGRRGPWYPDRTPELVLLEEEEIMVVL